MNKILTYISLFFSLGVFSGCILQDVNTDLAYKIVDVNDDSDMAIEWEARALFEQRKQDFSPEEWEKGPCLGVLNDSWVVDVVHRHRTQVDDDLDNQCRQYYEDENYQYYVLIDFDGNIIKKKSKPRTE